MWPSPSCGSRPNWRGARLEVVDDRLDDDRVAGLAGAVARGDDLYAGLARHRCRARLVVFGVGAAAEDQRQRQTAAVAASAAKVAVLLRIGAGTLRATSRTTCDELPIAILALVARPRRRGARGRGRRPGRARQPLRRHPARARAPSAAATTSPARRCPSGWSSGAPTRPPSAPHSGGYDHRDNHLRGFSLTHLSGAGCALYGDFPFLPTTEPLTSSPAAPGGRPRRPLPARLLPRRGGAPRPGFYEVRLNPARGADIDVALTATTRTGMARFEFPPQPARQRPHRRRRQRPARRPRRGRRRPRPPRNLRHRLQRPLLRPAAALPGLLRRRLRSPLRRLRDLAGELARPRRPRRPKTARRRAANPRTTAQAGAYASFDTRQQPHRHRPGRRSPSSASTAPAPTSPPRAAAGASARSRRRARAALEPGAGPGPRQRRPEPLLDTFYTALYHAFLAPRTFSDVGGAYPGMDGAIHRARGRTQYADFSGWDIYRTQVPAAGAAGAGAGERHDASRCSPTPSRAAACRAGPTPTARA